VPQRCSDRREAIFVDGKDGESSLAPKRLRTKRSTYHLEMTFLKTWKVIVLIAHRVLPEPTRPVMSQPRTKSSSDQDRPARHTTGLPAVSAAKSVPVANRAQTPITPHDRGGSKRKYATIEPKSGKEQNQAASSKDLGLSFRIRKLNSRFSGSGMLCVKALKFTPVRGSESGSAT
jgi:hypothetical protein